MKEQERGRNAEPLSMVRIHQVDRDLDLQETSSGPQDALTEEEAERLTTDISHKLGIIADNTEAVMPLIREAIERNAYAALGYPSHGAYVAERFGDTLTRLEVAQRRDLVRELTAAGMSNRATGAVLGVNEKTVRNDLRTGADNSAPDLPVKITGQDGKAYPRRINDLTHLPRDEETERHAELARRSAEDARGIERAIKTLTGLDVERRRSVRGLYRPVDCFSSKNLQTIAENLRALADEWKGLL